MVEQTNPLYQLLASELPLDAVGPHLRQAARRALRSGDSERLRLVGRSIVGELLRRGDLLRVVMEDTAGQGNQSALLCLIKGTNRVVDLSCLGPAIDTVILPGGFQPLRPLNNVVSVPDYNATDFADVLGAMEEAQDLDIGDPQSGDKALGLVGILRLLARFAPQFHLSIMVAGDEPLPAEQGGIFQLPATEIQDTWMAYRESGQAVWIPTLSELPQPVLDRVMPPDGASNQSNSAVAVPLWEPESADEPLAPRQEAGLLFVVAAEQWHREALLRLAERLSRFVTRRWHRQREVNLRIHTDSLTGVFNRAFFDSRFALELERARRSDVPLTLVIADIDHFKRINDRLGHHIGDRTLQMVARRLQEELRRIDLICRIGGEEFALILPDTGQEAGQEVMGRLLDAPLREDVESDTGTQTLEVTFSYGAVTFPAAGADAFELYRKADAMLYLSKDLGRNQCHFWNSQGEHLRLTPTAKNTDS